MYRIEKLSGHKFSKCSIIVNEESYSERINIKFISYNSLSIEADIYPNSIEIRKYYFWESNTTKRQLSWFFKEYFPFTNYKEFDNNNTVKLRFIKNEKGDYERDII